MLILPSSLSPLCDRGYQVFSASYPLSIVKDLKDVAPSLASSGVRKLSSGEVSPRGDTIMWLSPDNDPLSSLFWSDLEKTKQYFNRELFLGLRSFESHIARYQPGKGYMRHRDTFAHRAQASSPRVLSMVMYFNQAWQEEDGGALCLYPEKGPSVRILPRFGACVVFRSEMEHEVLPSLRERWSVASWFS